MRVERSVRPNSLTVLVVVAASVACGTAAIAGEQTILGKRLAIANPGAPTSRKLACAAVERHSANTVVGEPTVGGGVLEVIVHGGTSSEQAFALPQGARGKGRRFWSGSATAGYKYTDAKGRNGPVRAVRLQRRAGGTLVLSATLAGAHGDLAIVPPNPGTDGCVALTLAGGDRYSVAFGPTSTVKDDDGSSFVARKPAAEGVCDAVMTGTTTTTIPGGPCAASNFLDLSGAPGPGGSYASLTPSLSVSCGASTVTVRSNGIPSYQYVALTPNGLQAKSYAFTFPRFPAIAATTTPVPLLGNMGVAVNGIPIYAVNEGPQPPTDAYGDPIAAAILDQCGSHSAPQGTFHHHKLVVKCLLPSAVSEMQPWNDPDPAPSAPSPILGYAFDGFPIYGPYECADASCASVQQMLSGWDSTGYQAGTAGCASSAACASGYCTAVMIGGVQTTACVPKTCAWSNNTFTAKAGSAYLDQCNGHVGPGGDYHYHATSTFPYIVGCYRGTPSANGGNGTPPGGSCP